MREKSSDGRVKNPILTIDFIQNLLFRHKLLLSWINKIFSTVIQFMKEVPDMDRTCAKVSRLHFGLSILFIEC
jgi:hypothetical protein